MKVYVNDHPVQVFSGATVKHALIQEDALKEVERGKKVYDEWGSEVGLDGALAEGTKLYLR